MVLTFIDYAATASYFVYSFFLLIQARELVRRKTLGSLSLIEITIRLFSGYILLKKVLLMDDQFLITGQKVFTFTIILLWIIAMYTGLRHRQNKPLTQKNWRNIAILISAGAALILMPVNGAVLAIGGYLIYGLVVQSIKVWERQNIVSIVFSEVTVRLIGCFFVTTKVLLTRDIAYGIMQSSFAISLTSYWLLLIFVAHRTGEIKERWKQSTARLRTIFVPASM